MDVYEIRKANLLRLLEGQKKAKFAEDVQTSSSYPPRAGFFVPAGKSLVLPA